jgi:hypothetical protein
MGAAYQGHWGTTAGFGEVLLLAGLICGLGVFVIAVAGERRTPQGPSAPPGGGEPDLMPLASPEHQAFLADPPPPLPVSPAPSVYPTFPGNGSGS